MNTKISKQNSAVLTTTVLAVLLTLCLAQEMTVNAQANTEIVKSTVTIPASFYNDCSGEFINGVFQGVITTRITEDASGGVHYQMRETYKGSFVGETSGAKYTSSQTGQVNFTFTARTAFTTTSLVNYRLIGQGKTDNLSVQILFHNTVTPNGNVTAEVENISSECR